MTTLKKFCPTCDQLVDVTPPDDQRCPTCHKALAPQPQVAAVPAQTGGGRGLVIAAGALLVAAAAGGWWWTQRGPQAANAGKTQAEAVDLTGKFKALGLSVGRANPPGVADAAMQKWAQGQGNAAAVLAQLADRVKPGGFGQLTPVMRRKYPVLDTAELWQQIEAGKARPIHSVEAALLAKALLVGRGETAQIVMDTEGLQTPLMLSRTRLGVQLADGTAVEPLTKAKIAKPRVVSDAEAAATWLVLRANAHRLAGDFKLVAEDLSAAEALAPQLEAVRFVRGVAQLDQRMQEPGVAACEGALAKVEDPLARLFLAEIALTMDQPVKALQQCDAALKASPGLPEALVTRAMIALQRLPTLPADQKDKAIAQISDDVEVALKSPSPPAGARVAKAQVLLAKKDEQQAELLLTAAVREHHDVEATLLLSQLLQSKGKVDEAAALFESSKAPIDDERVALAWASTLIAAKQPDKALQIAEKAFAAAPDSPNLGLLRADLLRQTGKTAEAIAALEPLKKGADGDRIALLQAQLYLQNRAFDKALPVIAAQYAKKPADREVAMLQVVALTMAGKSDEADKAAQTAIDAKVLKSLEVIELYLQSNQLPKAQKLLEAEVAKGKPEANIAATLAVVYAAQGMKDKAIALRDQVTKEAGDKGEEIKKLIDASIESAEAEAKAAKEASGHNGDDAKGP